MRNFLPALLAVVLLGSCTNYNRLSWGGDVGWEDARRQAQNEQLVAAVTDAHQRGDAASDQTAFQSTASPVLDVPATGRVVVLPGDTLSHIAERYDVGLSVLAKLNGIERPYQIFVGQEIWLRPAPPAPQRYQVASGDTFLEIAHRYGLRYDTLRRRNPDVNPDRLLVGQTLNIEFEPPDTPAAPVLTAKLEEAAKAPTPRRSADGFQWPVDGEIITPFGALPNGSRSDGINIAAVRGSTVRAADAGIVVYAGEAVSGMGRMLMIRHADEYLTAYGHNQTLLVTIGDRVAKGQPIAKAGDTGSVNQAQLHFQVRRGTEPVDPMSLLRGSGLRYASRN